MRSNTLRASESSASVSKSRRWSNPAAFLTAFVMMISTVVLGQGFIAPEATAQYQSTGTITPTGGWRPVPNALAGPLTPLGKDVLYGTSDGNTTGNIWTYARTGETPHVPGVPVTNSTTAMSTYQVSPVSTMAMDANPNGTRFTDVTSLVPGEPVRYAYFWGWNSLNSISASQATALGLTSNPTGYAPIFRVQEGSRDAQLLLIPRPGTMDNQTTLNYWSGGEVFQRTGEIYFGDGECGALNGTYSIMIFNPATGAYNHSGRIEPLTAADNIFGTSVSTCGGTGYVASDLAIDGNGNAYILVQDRRASGVANQRNWIVRVVPSKDGSPWRYNLVTPLRPEGLTGAAQDFARGQRTVWGMAFFDGMLYATTDVGDRLMEINPMSGEVKDLGTYQNPFDMASGQTARVIDGVVYEDVDGNGAIDGADVGVADIQMALYERRAGSSTYVFMGDTKTDTSGNYTFIVGHNGDYLVRVVQPSMRSLKAVQTYATGASGAGVRNPITAKCMNGDITVRSGGLCVGAIPPPYSDPDLKTGFSEYGTNTDTQPNEMPIQTQVVITTDEEVASTDFGITVAGSFGDSAAGPNTIPAAPAHINGAVSNLWLGTRLGTYAGPATDGTAHNATDDGVFINSYAGKLPLTNSGLVATKEYTAVADLSGPAINQAFVKGWFTGVNNTTWETTARWTPTISGATATGPLKVSNTMVAGRVDMRVDASTTNIAVPTNATGAYYSASGSTIGEIEDYALTVGNSVYRPAAHTVSGTANFKVAGQQFNDVGTTLKVGTGVVAVAETAVSLTAEVPDSNWTISGVVIKDTFTGAEVSRPTPTITGNVATFSYTPALESDVIVEVLFARNPDPNNSTLVMSPMNTANTHAEQVVGQNITATVTVRDASNAPLPGAVVTFSKVSADITLPVTTCTTIADGTCSVTLTSTKIGVYTNEISAKVMASGASVDISGSPATVEFIPSVIHYPSSTFAVTPVVDPADTSETNWRVANGTDAYTGVLTVRDEYLNPISDIDVSRIHFSATGSAVPSTVQNTGNGTYTVTFTSTVASATPTASLIVDTTAVGTAKPIPFKAGPAVLVCANQTIACTRLVVDKTALNVGETANATAYVTDYYGNPVKNQAVTFSISTGTDAVLTPVGTTDTAGRATATISNIRPQTVTLRAQITPGEIPGSPVDLTWSLVPVVAPDKSTFVVTPVAVPTDSTTWVEVSAPGGTKYYTATMIARDQYENVLTNLTAADIAKIVFTPSSAAVDKTPVVLTGGGYSTQLTSTEATTTTIPTVRLTYDTQPVTASDNTTTALPIPFKEGPAALTCVNANIVCTKLTVDYTTRQVGQTSIATAYVTDAYGNKLANVPVTFVLDTGTSGLLTVTQGSTGVDGNATATVSDTKPETVVLRASIAAGALPGSPASIVFGLTQEPKPENCELVVSPVVNPADPDKTGWIEVSEGTYYYTGTIILRDEYNNLLPDVGAAKMALIKFTPSSADVLYTSVVNAGNGAYTVRLYSTVATASTTVSVTYNSVTVKSATGATALPIPFKSGPGKPTCLEPDRGSRLSASQTSLDVGGTTQISAYVTDWYCNPVQGEPVTFSLVAGSSGELGTNVPILTDATGYARTTLRDNKAEVVQVNGRITNNTEAIQDSPVSVTFNSKEIWPANSTFDVSITTAGATTVLANGEQSWTGKLYAEDQLNNPLTDLTPAQIAKLTWGVTPTGVTVTGFVNTGGGNYTVLYKTTTAGSYTASLRYDGAQIGTNKTISFVAGPVDIRYSSVSVNPTEQTVGAPVTITVVAKDAFQNPVTGLTQSQVAVVGQATGVPNLTLGTMQEISPGEYTYTATSKLKGTFEITAVVTGLTLTQRPTVQFTAGGVCISNCDPVDPTHVTRFEMVRNDQPADGSSTDTAIAYAYDTYGNEVSNITVRIVDQTTGDLAGYLTPATQSKNTGANGTATFEWSSIRAGIYTAEGTVGQTPGAQPTLRPVTGVLNQIRFSSGAVRANTSELVVTPTSPIEVGNSYTATVTARDATGNVLNGETISFRLSPTTPATLSANSCTTNISGVCSVTVYSELIASAVEIHATVSEAGVPKEIGGNGDASKASPRTVAWESGDVCVVNCTPVDSRNVTRVEVVEDGAQANGSAVNRAQAYAYDRFGNPVRNIVVTSETTVTGLIIVTPIPNTNTSGTSTIEYRSNLAGTHLASVKIDGKTPAIAKSYDGSTTTDGRIKLTFMTGPAGSVSLAINPTTTQEVGSTFNLTVTVRDASSNPVTGAVVTFSPVTNIDYGAPSCTTVTGGTCTVTATSIRPGSYEMYASLPGVQSNKVTATFTVGPVCVTAACSTRVEMTTNGVEANGTARDIATVYAFDQYNNPVTGATVTSTPAAGETSLIIQDDIGKISDTGTVTIWYASSTAGEHKADVRVNGLVPRGSPISPAFGNGAGNPLNSSWIVRPHNAVLVVGEAAASTYTATATIKDATNNVVPGAVVNFTLDPTGPVMSAYSCITNSSGQCSVTVFSTKSGTYTMAASIVAGAIKNADTNTPATSLVWKADDVCSTAEGCVPVDPNLPNEYRTRVVLTTNNQIADGAGKNVITAYGFDKWGNAVEGALVQATSTSVVDIQDGIAPLNKAGSTTIWYTTKVAGTKVTSITIDSHLPVGSPVTMTFVAGSVCIIEAGCVPDPGVPTTKHTRVEVTRNNQPVDGQPDQVTAYAFDKSGNSVANIQFDFVKSLVSDDLVIQASCVTTTAGTCIVDATAYVAKAHLAKASVNGTELTAHGSPASLTFVAGGVCVKEAGCVPDGPAKDDPTLHTRAVVLTNDGQLTHAGVDPALRNMDTIGIYAFDKYGNPVQGTSFNLAGDLIDFHFASDHARTAVRLTGTDGTDTVQVYATDTEAQSVTVRVAGTNLAPLQLRFLAAPVITAPTTGSIVKDKPLTISGTATTPGYFVDVYSDGLKVCQGTVSATGTWSCQATLTDAAHSLTAQKRTTDGALSEVSVAVAVTIDTAPPTDPVVNNTNGSLITGTADKDSTVTVKDKTGNPIPGCINVAVDASTGKFSCSPTSPSDRPKPGDEITVTAKDAAGNESNPVKVVIRALAIEILHSSRLRDEAQVVSGYNFNPGERVHLVITSLPYDAGYQTANAEGTVTFNLKVPLDFEQGSHTATLTGDVSGTVSGTFGVIVPTGGTVLVGMSSPYLALVGGTLMLLVGLLLLSVARRNGRETLIS